MVRDLVLGYLKELKGVIDGIPLERFHQVLDVLLDAYKRESSIFIMGNGGSAATASHFACDINKGACFDLKKKFKVICLNDNIPTMLAYANDVSYADIFLQQLRNFLKPHDLVIGISGSGNSENVLKAIEFGNKNAGLTVGLTGFDGGRLAKIAQLPLVVKSNDMQKVEDVHLIITHIIMQAVYKELHNK